MFLYFDFDKGNWCFVNGANVDEFEEDEWEFTDEIVCVPEGGGGGFMKLT